MWLIRAALRRPFTVVVAVIAVALLSVLALMRMPVDIFPNLNLPVIYVAQPYGGMSPAQMEGYLVYYYEYHFLYITGIESVESKSIQNVGLLKLTFHPGTNMSQALAQTISYVDRARAFMPAGTVPPFVMRFDAGSVPVGYLVFSSQARGLGEIQDLALNRVRPLFATLPGVSAPPPFGGNQRTIVVTVDPDRLRSYHMSPEEVIRAVSSGNIIMPAGNIRAGDLQPMVPINSVVTNIQELRELPIRTGSGPTVLLRDIGNVADSSDVLTGYALVNGRRAIYLSVTKRADASTVAVVNEVKNNIARFRSLIPEDIKISYEFDQSSYVKNALYSLMREGILGALLTGLMVLLFLRDLRSSAIVVTTIPFALLAAVVALWGAGQTINTMTLGGMALAVGILVDEATVAIENIHTHLGQGVSPAKAVRDASREVAIPRLLAMLCVLSVFVPSFFMTGIARSLFVPLSLSVGFAMAASYLLSSSLVPVMSTWILRQHERPDTRAEAGLGRWRDRLGRTLERLMQRRKTVLLVYLGVSLVIIVLLGPLMGREIFPSINAGQFQLRFRAPTGTRVGATEVMVLRLLEEIQKAAGNDQVAITLGYVGTQPPAYPINTIFLWTSGPQEAVLRIALQSGSHVSLGKLEEHLRQTLPGIFPGCQFSFGAGDIVSQIMNFGAPTPIEVAVTGPNLQEDRGYAEKIRTELGKVAALRDLQFEQPLDYPSVEVNVNRELAGQMGVSVEQVGRSVVAATSSSRFVTPNYWADPRSGIAYQVQIQMPQSRLASVQDVESIPITRSDSLHPLVGDVAQVRSGTMVGEYDRFNGSRMITISANVVGEDLGRIAKKVEQAVQNAGTPPRGVSVKIRGQIAPMRDTLTNLAIGLGVAILVVFLLLVANFQSMRLALVVLATIPAVISGVIVMLLITGTTLNIQSFMGAIMAIGVAVANAILLVTFAEQSRHSGMSATAGAIHGAQIRMRPILMTSAAMIAGMIPMAIAIGTGAEQTAPLGRAVIGGLLAATLTSLLILPSLFSLAQDQAGTESPSLDPEDPASRYAAQEQSAGDNPNQGGQ
ncbi:MAG TPA: efflux RND transporter permease subunit [Candidatus Sulfotelmatobacter sp.]|nr:efflux RND transporter permease subunit [Candidatus Sulfotelmatobacter sp.]